MLYMGNVNRFIFWVLIPLILLSYIALRIFEWNHYDDDGGRLEIAQQHSMNLSNRTDVNCLILGGSNAVFGLSAKQMSSDDNLNCYNLSLLNEGFSDEAYFEFINSMPINRMEIAYVFYSTVYPLTADHFTKRLKNNEDNIDIVGESNFQLVQVSLAARLNGLLQEKPFFPSHRYPNPTASGDFNFELYERCDSASVKAHEWDLTDEEDAVKNWRNANLSRIQSLFQNAQVYFVLPSTLRSNVNKDDLATFFNFLQAELAKQSVTYIEQSPFPSRDVVCDGILHANELGREIRTSELLKLFYSQNN